MPLKPGDKAPDFTLLDQDGNPFTLSKHVKEKKVRTLIYFYPSWSTPGRCGTLPGRAGDAVWRPNVAAAVDNPSAGWAR
jgi:hypothetical protein